MLKYIAKLLLTLIPYNSPILLKAAHHYIDRANGDNNSNSITNGEWYLINTILPKIPEGGVIFDVGANIGQWTKYCLSVCPNKNFHLFEPSRFTFNELQKNKWPEIVKLNNFGFGELADESLLYIINDGSGMNSMYERRNIRFMQANVVEKISIRTIDEYCEENGIYHIDFLKIDVEGHELSVLKGASNLLKVKAINLIQFEYGGCNLDARVFLLDIWNFLEPHGYMIGKLNQKSIKFFNKYDQSLETFKYSNYVAKLIN